MRPARVRLVAVACGALLAVLAGCTSGGGTTSSSSASTPATATSSGSPSPVPPTPTTSSPPATSAPPTTSPAPTPPSTPSPGLPTCAALDVTVTRVPGAAGVTFGLISVTNRGTARCALPGVPTVRLLDAARAPVTSTATPITAATAALDPGGVASTLLQDRSDTCQADTRSTYAEVTPTPAAATVVLPLSLPPCTLSVKPFSPGSQPQP